MLFGVRLAARRPRRLALGILSVAVSEAGIVAILIERARLDLGGTAGLVNPQHQRLTDAMLVITVMLVVLAAVNALLITWATIVDARHASALARALGATPQQVSAGMSAAQFVAVFPGSVLGIPLGIALIEAVTGASDAYKVAPLWWYLPVILGTWLVMSTITAIPALFGSRRSVTQILQGELG